MNLNVNQAVWVAAAMMTYERIIHNHARTLDEIALVQADIQKRAQQLASDHVDGTRISQHFNADHPNKTYNYLRQINATKRRISYIG